MAQTNACCVYDATCYDWLDPENPDEKKWIEVLDRYCKKWSFQLERGELNGHLHWQMRFSLKIKMRANQLPGIFGTKETRYSVTTKDNRDNHFYTTKEHTRVKGPWSDKENTPVYIPIDIRMIEDLLPWQEQLKLQAEGYELRKVLVLFDPKGDIGKTTFTRWMMCKNLGEMVPPIFEHAKDFIRCVYDIGPKKCYFFDMPKAMDKKKLKEFYSAVEMIKTGFAFDDRYTYKRRLFDPPNIIIFTNVMPDRELLTKNRWKFVCVSGQTLFDFDPDNKEHMNSIYAAKDL